MPLKSVKSRGPQQRSQDTRNALLNAATELFTLQGYEGVSVRALETAAQVQHGAVTYHFKNKEMLWKAAIDELMANFASYIDPLRATMADLDDDARLRMIVAAIVRYSAQTPELSQLMVQEGRFDTWRLKYLLDNFMRDGRAWLVEMIDVLNDPHTYYIAIGAMTQVFDVAHACKELFGVDPSSDAFIKEHAGRVADMLIGMRRKS